MIFIKTHTDFAFNEIPIHKENYNDYSIICREKLNDNYPINIIYDNNNFLNKWTNLYGDMTYHYYVYKHINEYDNIIGLIQYRRFTNEHILNNYKDILKEYDIILPCKLNYNLISHYNLCHIPYLLEYIIDLIHKYKKSYRNIDLYNIDYTIPHNIFIMNKEDYVEYCKFMFWCYEIFNIKYNIYNKINDNIYYRILSFLGERLSTIFYIKHFISNNRKIYYYNEKEQL
jgi:hypothetical protein